MSANGRLNPFSPLDDLAQRKVMDRLAQFVIEPIDWGIASIPGGIEATAPVAVLGNGPVLFAQLYVDGVAIAPAAYTIQQLHPVTKVHIMGLTGASRCWSCPTVVSP